VSILSSMLFLGERLDLIEVIGCATVIFGVVIIITKSGKA
jgi:drug/metabolite transporter (DMT)-like permease